MATHTLLLHGMASQVSSVSHAAANATAGSQRRAAEPTRHASFARTTQRAPTLEGAGVAAAQAKSNQVTRGQSEQSERWRAHAREEEGEDAYGTAGPHSRVVRSQRSWRTRG